MRGQQQSRTPLLSGSIPGVDKPASRIIYGTLFLHNLPSEEDAFLLLDGVWAAGCNALDCAAIYGGGVCEQRVGAWLRSRSIPRDEIVLISKGGCEGQDKLWCATIADHTHMRSEISNSLRRLGVDYIDCYLLHRDDPSLPVGQIVRFMDEMCSSGMIKTWGVSNWQKSRLQAALEHAERHGLRPPVADSPQNSLAEPSRAVWPNTAFMSPSKREEWLEATSGNVALLGWECLAKGFMCGKWTRADGEFTPEDDVLLSEASAPRWRELQLRIAYCNKENFDRRDRALVIAREKGVALPEVALGYVLSQHPRSFALVGTTSLSHFEQNARAAAVDSVVATLTPEELRYLEMGAPRPAVASACDGKRRRAPLRRTAAVAALAAALAAGTAQLGSLPSSPHSLSNGAVRFAGASTDAGRLEVWLNGGPLGAKMAAQNGGEKVAQSGWASVCAAAGLSRPAAAVACRQLGFGIATGTMSLPGDADEQAGGLWLSGVACNGTEASLLECAHAAWGARADGCDAALGVRCLACEGEQCSTYAADVRLSGAVSDVSLVADAYVRGAPVHMSCVHDADADAVDCYAAAYDDVQPPARSGAQQQDREEQLDESVLSGLPDPFGDTARHAFHFSDALAAEYAERRRALLRYLHAHPSDAAALRTLSSRGALRSNAAGLIRSPLLAELNASSRLYGLVRSLYLSPRVQMVADLDADAALHPDAHAHGHSHGHGHGHGHGHAQAHAPPDASDLTHLDASAARIASALFSHGVAEIDDFGLDIAALNETIDEAFAKRDSSVTSVAANGASMATRVELPALEPLIMNASINAAVKAYLGADAVLDGYKVVRLAPHAAAADNIASLWHNDRAGHRLKLFVRLHDVDPRSSAGSHPTLVARGSHNLLHYSFEGYEHSRYTDEFVRSEYSVVSLGGKMGSGFIFDTNTIHKAVPEGLRGRTAVVLEYHSALKCPVIHALDLPIPCPSGDQRLVQRARRHAIDEQAAARANPGGANAGANETHTAARPPLPAYRLANQCVSWADADAHDAALAPVALPEVLRGVHGNAAVRLNGEKPFPYVVAPATITTTTTTAASPVLSVRADCAALWRRYSFDVMPLDGNTVWWDVMGTVPLRHGLCFYEGELGYVPFDGRDAGGCVTPSRATPSFGNFDMLLAFPNANSASRSAPRERRDAQAQDDESTFRALVDKYLSESDAAMLREITGVPLSELVQDVVAAGDTVIEALQRTPLMAAVLSAARFVPHALNSRGLHLLRVLLAERMSDRRRDEGDYGDDAARLREQWLRDGYLLLDFDKYTSSQGVGNALLEDVLRMTSASPGPTEPLEFVNRQVVHVANDPQYALHVDTFHPVIKLWVYDHNVTLDSGPMHYVPGSHRSSVGKLRWLYERTRDNDPQVIMEPSLRYDAANSPALAANAKLAETGFELATPVLPLPHVPRTLIIADTSGLHCRGVAQAGAARPQLRPMGAHNDGGVKRLNPFRPVGAA